jgi:predicted Rossmann-fold nucleotide-binding protein
MTIETQTAPSMADAMQAAQTLTNFFPDLTPHERQLAILDLTTNVNNPTPTNGYYLFGETVRLLRPHKTVGILGGSRLDASRPLNESLFRPLNRALAACLYAGGWSVVSGGGPGTAMKGLQACLKENTNQMSPRNCLTVGVQALLNDEILHKHLDIVVRSPGGNVPIREQMILALSKTAIFYPGHIGTLNEFSDTAVKHYLHGRGIIDYRPPRSILVTYKMPDGSHFWQDQIKQFQEKSVAAQLTKGESGDWLKIVTLKSPEEIAALDMRNRDKYFSRVAEQIMLYLDGFILADFGADHKLTAGFSANPLELSNEYFAGFGI